MFTPSRRHQLPRITPAPVKATYPKKFAVEALIDCHSIQYEISYDQPDQIPSQIFSA